MITSDNPLPIISGLVARGMRDRALNWYALNPYEIIGGSGGIIATDLNFSIRSTVESGYIVEPSGQSFTSGANVQMWEQTSAANSYQNWAFVYDRDRDAYRIGVTANNSMALTWDSSGAFSGGNRDNVIVYDQRGGVFDDQYWLVEPSDTRGQYILRNYKDPSKILAFPGERPGNGVNVHVVTGGNSPQARWLITPILAGIGFDKAYRVPTQLDNGLAWNLPTNGPLTLAPAANSLRWYFTWNATIDLFEIRPSDRPAQVCLAYSPPPGGGARDVRTANCSSSSDQGWIIQPQWNNRGYIVRNAAEPSMLLVVTNAAAFSGQRIILHEQSSDVTQRNQLWSLTG